MPTVVLLGTLDTKGHEYEYLRERITSAGCATLMVDAGVLGPPLARPDVTRDELARAAGADIRALAARNDRGAAVATMGRGASIVVQQLHAAGRLDGIVALGGSGGTTLAAVAMQALPIGVPKLLVSTVAAGDTRPYVGSTDITMMYSVVDIAGLNRFSRRILANAAAAIAGMARATPPVATSDRPLVGATMFGVTTPAVTAARERLEELGYEVLVFHATGVGGKSMESLVRDGFIGAVLDLTTTELADDLVGGICSAGADRLEIAGQLGLPQVVSLGALDMVNFGPLDTVPHHLRGRHLYQHNANVTLMRTDPAENAELGRRIARKLNAAQGPLTLFVPLRGLSVISTAGAPFYDPGADQALFAALRETLDAAVDVREIDTDVNDPQFARALAERLHQHFQAWQATTAGIKT